MKLTFWRVLGVIFIAFLIVMINNEVYKQKHPGYGVDLTSTVTPYPIDTTIFTNLALESQKLSDKNLQAWYITMSDLDHALVMYSAGRLIDNDHVSEDFFYAHEGFKVESVKADANMRAIYTKTGQLFDLMDIAMRKASSKQEWLQDRSQYLQLATKLYDVIQADIHKLDEFGNNNS